MVSPPSTGCSRRRGNWCCSWPGCARRRAASRSGSSCAWGRGGSSWRCAGRCWRREWPLTSWSSTGRRAAPGPRRRVPPGSSACRSPRDSSPCTTRWSAVGLRDRVRIGASGRVATGPDVVTRLVQGADYTNAARAMMLAVGCVQAGLCHTNAARPVWRRRTRCARVAWTWPTRPRGRALSAGDGARRRADHGGDGRARAGRAHPAHLVRRLSSGVERSYADLYEWLSPGELLAGPPPSWEADWKAAGPDGFG